MYLKNNTDKQIRVGIVVCNYNVQQSNLPVWINKVLTGLAAQLFSGKLDVLISDNMSSPAFLKTLGEFCQSHSTPDRSFSYISETDHQDVGSSMNLGFYTVNKMCEECDIFGYSSDDVWFSISDTGALSRVVQEFNDKSLGIVSVCTDRDNAERSYKNLNTTSGKSVKLKLWECVNHHFMLYSREFLEAYDYRYVDTMVWSIESVLTFLCAAIDKEWMLSRAAIIHNGKKTKRKKPKGYRTGFYVVPEHEKYAKTLKDLISPGKEVGLGFNCFNRIAKLNEAQMKSLPGDFYWMDYDESLYDEHGKCKTKELLVKFINNNLFRRYTNYANRLEKSDKLFNI